MPEVQESWYAICKQDHDALLDSESPNRASLLAVWAAFCRIANDRRTGRFTIPRGLIASLSGAASTTTITARIGELSQLGFIQVSCSSGGNHTYTMLRGSKYRSDSTGDSTTQGVSRKSEVESVGNNNTRNLEAAYELLRATDKFQSLTLEGFAQIHQSYPKANLTDATVIQQIRVEAENTAGPINAPMPWLRKRCDRLESGIGRNGGLRLPGTKNDKGMNWGPVGPCM